MVAHAAAENHVPGTLELGGKSAHIVFDDANYKLAIPAIVKGIVHNAGQTCTAGSRLLVQKGIYADFMKALAEEFSKVRAGTPDMDLTCGPVVNKAQFDRVNRYIAKGLADGLKVAAEGASADGVPTGGYFVKPTLSSDPWWASAPSTLKLPCWRAPTTALPAWPPISTRPTWNASGA
ncbi:hypothetical protein G6F45_013536 [Rhizopus arrhizus]|nr:hypothetical protein G6F45_013536 [Rhizopus arrhizus]